MEIVVLAAIVLVAAAIVMRKSLPALANRSRMAFDAFIGRSPEEAASGLDSRARRLIEVAVAAVDEARRAGTTTPTMLDIACSPHDHRALTARTGEVERALGARVGADVRLCLRDFGELRRGSFLVLGADDGDATSVIGAGIARADTVAFEVAAAATRALPSAALLTASDEHVLGPAATVGRSAASEVVLASRHLSGRHATIEHVGSTWLLVDHSSNGTWVGGRRIERDEPHPLHDGDRLRFADVECTFVVGGA